jgi:hypothetical protein
MPNTAACQAIRRASTEGQVMAAIREYLSSLTAAQLALLPAEVLEIGLSQAEDLVHSALQLVHGQVASKRNGEKIGLLEEVAEVLSTAAQRLAELATDPA